MTTNFSTSIKHIEKSLKVLGQIRDKKAAVVAMYEAINSPSENQKILTEIAREELAQSDLAYSKVTKMVEDLKEIDRTFLFIH
jgi:hypothetical protein